MEIALASWSSRTPWQKLTFNFASFMYRVLWIYVVLIASATHYCYWESSEVTVWFYLAYIWINNQQKGCTDQRPFPGECPKAEIQYWKWKGVALQYSLTFFSSIWWIKFSSTFDYMSDQTFNFFFKRKFC